MAQEIFHKKWLKNLGYHSLKLFPYKFLLNHKHVKAHYEQFKGEGEYLNQFLNVPYRLTSERFLGEILYKELVELEKQNVEVKIRKIRAINAITYFIGLGTYRSPSVVLMVTSKFQFVDYYFREYYGDKNRIILSFLFKIIHSLGLANEFLEKVEQTKDLKLFIFILNEFMVRQMGDHKRRLGIKEVEIIQRMSEQWKDNIKISWMLYKLYIDQDLM
ncbi:unnamed protein product (macronuclear) [Paramecium tetraurelia]|uniref:Uncharacterized protein n=1 Tax=Paramecium tetraurelia TaxID=5888 RepID=A0E9K1_PARTE|nr:uncharacterized protein GSPATT00024699001 [Paramecium tetraurelia]CAK91968.1 unnamed protein product [Paramecium tetraurelia]|eukprot:XP_001459365.1 hypothetical protein (macronuclear) [Paramecium tetraurelia strain d4-2]